MLGYRVDRERRRLEVVPAEAQQVRVMAQAHDLEARVQAGEFRDYADVARHHGLTCARLTQVMNLLLLAPDIQAEVLALRRYHSPVWAEQRVVWRSIRASSNQ